MSLGLHAMSLGMAWREQGNINKVRGIESSERTNAPQPLKLQFCGVTLTPDWNLLTHVLTCSGEGQTKTSHLDVSTPA